MARTWMLAGLALILAVSAGCGGPRIRTDHASTYDFTRLHTYGWAPLAHPDRKTPELRGRDVAKMVRGAVDRELQAKGYRKAGKGESPDFLVAYLITVEQKLDAQTVHRMYGYGRGWGHSGGRAPYETETYVQSYEEGTLLLDVIDPARNEAVWRGSARARVDRTEVDEKIRKRVRETVAKILEAFPPK